ncbi:unnamed protein product [Rhizopus stolonifer]
MLVVPNGQAAYEMLAVTEDANQVNAPSLRPELINYMETYLLNAYFKSVHPAYLLPFKKCIMKIHSADRNLLSKPLRYAIIMSTLASQSISTSNTYYQLTQYNPCYYYTNTTTTKPLI